MVPLVDYSSDSSESDVVDSSGPRLKKQKTDGDNNGRTTTTANATATKSELPPLPSAFHDLYASTVRVSASDDPTLHQGRKRVNPHKAGHWPSHLYIECEFLSLFHIYISYIMLYSSPHLIIPLFSILVQISVYHVNLHCYIHT